MNRFLVVAIAGFLLLVNSQPARSDRLEAIWVGPHGNGGEGDWNTATNWNLGVVPNNGTDADGDGVPDIFDVRIDALPLAMSVIRTSMPPAEVAGLTVDTADTLNFLEPLALVFRDPDSQIDVINHGNIRVMGTLGVTPHFAFAGEALHLSGTGILDLGITAGPRAIIAAITPGGRVINGPQHTIRTSGRFRSARIHGYVPNNLNSEVALTNDGLILVEGGSVFSAHLNSDAHVNSGTIRVDGSNAWFQSDQRGSFLNSGTAISNGPGTNLNFVGLDLLNSATGTVLALNQATVQFNARNGGSIRNAGLIEASGEGTLDIRGSDVINEANGVVRASNGGIILLIDGVFGANPNYQLLDRDSTLVIGFRALYENEEKVLSPGPGTLAIGSGHVRGGELTNGPGRLEFFLNPLLEDLTLTGSAIGTGVRLGGEISVLSSMTFESSIDVQLAADTRFTGPGISRFPSSAQIKGEGFSLRIDPNHRTEAHELRVNNGTLENDGTVVAESAVVISDDATLEGTGMVIGAVAVNGTMSPGDGIGLAAFNISGDFFFGMNSRYQAQLGTMSSDLLDIAGDLSIAEAASLDLSGGEIGRSYVVSRFMGRRSGVFDNVTPGYNVIYDDLAKEIRVQPIPEPASVALALLGGIAAVTLRLRKRTRQAGA